MYFDHEIPLTVPIRIYDQWFCGREGGGKGVNDCHGNH